MAIQQKSKVGYSILFVLPTFILFTVFIIMSIGFTLYYSMTRWNAVSSPVFIWFNNYIKMFNSMEYWRILSNTIITILVVIFIQIPCGLIFSFLIYRTKRGAKFFRTAYFLPVVIAPTVIGLMFSLFLNSDIGPLNIILAKVGLESLQMQWLSDSRIVLYSVIIPGVWQFIGFYVVIFLAALYALPEEIFESAVVDGANSFQIFFKIVIPMLRSIIGVAAIFGVTGSLKYFEQPYIMTWGGPGVRSTLLGLYVYKAAFGDMTFGYASTVAVVILFIAVMFTLVFKKISFEQNF